MGGWVHRETETHLCHPWEAVMLRQNPRFWLKHWPYARAETIIKEKK